MVVSSATEGPIGPEPPPPDSLNQEGHAKVRRKNSEGDATLFPIVHLKPGFLFPAPLADNEDLPFGDMLHVEEQDADASLSDEGPKVVVTPKYEYHAVMIQDVAGENREWWQRVLKTKPT